MPRELRWVAQYADGRIVREFEYLGPPELGRLVETPWWTLNLSQVVSVGFEGSGLRVGFQVADGVIGVNGRGLFIALRSRDGHLIPISGPGSPVPKRIIQYKDAWAELSPPTIGRDGRRCGIEAYNIGWESTSRSDLLGEFSCQLLARIPTSEGAPVDVSFRLTTERGFVGETLVSCGRTVFPPIETLLRPNVCSMMVLHIGA